MFITSINNKFIIYTNTITISCVDLERFKRKNKNLLT